MTNPYRSQRERAAYEAGLAAGRSDKPPGKKKPLSKALFASMSTAETNERWPEIEEWLRAGQPEPEADNE